MGRVLDLLGIDFIQERIEGARNRIDMSRKERRPTPAALRRIFRKHERNPEETTPETNHVRALDGISTDVLMQLAQLEHAKGTKPDVVRGIFREAAAEWEPLIAAMDFKARVYEGETDDGKLAKSMALPFGGKVKKVGREYHYRFKTIPQPLWSDMEQVLACVAISGDQKLARKIAKAYKVPPAKHISLDGIDYTSSAVSKIILRHLIAGDDGEAIELSKKLRPGYNADFPPDLIEFPLGVVRNDPKLLLAGLKTLNARFKGRWDEKTWRRRHEKIRTGKIRLRPGVPVSTWDQMLIDVRKHLVNLHWLMSPFALAFLNVAAWRGMSSPFDKPEAFSECVPLSLCGVTET